MLSLLKMTSSPTSDSHCNRESQNSQMSLNNKIFAGRKLHIVTTCLETNSEIHCTAPQPTGKMSDEFL